MSASIWPSINNIAQQVQKGELKAVDLVNQSLQAIADKEEYKAIISTLNDRALRRAREIDEKVSKGQKIGALAGVPFVAKDNFLTFESETTAASNILKGFKAPYQATAVEKLELAGAICVAKANLDAFGHGASTENSDLMTTKNPHDTSRTPGGSSGGSAVAVALDMAPFALGTDTGGSTRLPASFSGCVGYKPTYGLISRSGVIAMASSTDTVGVLARSVDDVARVLDVIAGKDDMDATSINRDNNSYAKLDDPKKGSKIGVIKEYMDKGVNSGIKERVKQTVDVMKQAGLEVEEVSIPSLSLALACYYILVPAEISSNLSRYDGQHYGFSELEAKNADESYSKTRSTGFGNEAKRRIIIGTYVLSSGYYDAYYKKAQQLRTKLIKEFEETFKKVDYLIGPVAPTTAFKLGEIDQNPLQMYLMDVMTVAANLVGIPAISIPAGMIDGLPVGLQIMAPQRHDLDLLTMAKNTEELVSK